MHPEATFEQKNVQFLYITNPITLEKKELISMNYAFMITF